MKIRKVIKSDSAKDFTSLFFSNVLQKFFGFKVICAHANRVSKTVKYCSDCKLVLDES